MSMGQIQAIILAAGRSLRFNTSKTKLSHLICGQEIIAYSLKALKDLSIETTIVVGYQKEIIQEIARKYCPEISFVTQEQQLGTGHAIMCAINCIHADNVLIINGDMPLISASDIQNIISSHLNSHATITFATAYNPDPNHNSYGRVIKSGTDIEIIEPKDFTGDPDLHNLINAGIYVIKKSFLLNKINSLTNNNKSQELYLTDLIKEANILGEKVSNFIIAFDKIRGINTLKELWVAEHIKKSELIEFWMSNGVYFSCPQTTSIDIDVTIGKDTFIGAGAHITNKTTIGSGCKIEPYCVISNSIIGNDVTIKAHSVIEDSKIYNKVQVGPFAHIRNSSTLLEEANIGNFVEVTKSIIGAKSKAKHLAYIGNAQIGNQVNIGACSVTCNYNGITKNTTIINDNAFIGSNCALIAPVSIGKEAIIAAGSTITEDVPDNALAIARSKQTNKLEYAIKFKNKKSTISKININQKEL